MDRPSTASQPSPTERLLQLFTSAPKAFWRHDVDLSLSAAVKMAEFAQLAGISSTFYLMPRSPFYNLFSAEGQDALEHILAKGHKVGIHTVLRDEPVVDSIARDLKLLNTAYPGIFWHGPKASFHMPDERVLWKDFDWFENAYASKWKDRYMSDSRGMELARAPTNEMQINLHPEYWFR